MRRERTLCESVLSFGLVMLLLVQLMAPLGIQTMTEEPLLPESVRVDLTLPSNLEHGHDLAGQTIDVEGMTELLVRSDSSIDMWMSDVLVAGSTSNLSTPSVYLAENGSSYFCWMNDLGEVRMGIYTADGTFSHSLIDTVSTSHGLIGCSVVADESYRPLALFGDGADLRMARLAFEGQVYTTDTWLKRTIVEDLYPESMTLRYTDEGTEFAVVRTSNGELWQVNNSGLRWYHSLLDTGPVGEDTDRAQERNSQTDTVPFWSG